MDVGVTESLASGIDPTAIASLKAHPADPAVRRAVAGQFGAMLMQGLMRNADGSPLSMVEGVGGDTVSTLYTNVMSQVAASSDELGFADLLLKSMPAPPSANGTAAPASSGPTPTSVSPTASAPSTTVHGLSLQQYWQGRHVSVTPGAPLAIAPPPIGTRSIGLVPQVVPGVGAPPAAAPASSVAAPVAPANSSSPYNSLSGQSAQLSAPADAGASAARQRFAADLAPLLQNAAQTLGVSPNVLLAQAALESGWGRSMPGNNLFGVKAGAGWTGATVRTYTHEMAAAGKTGQTSSFRAYPSLAAAVADYVNLVAHNARYRAALGAGDDPLAYGRALVAGGYASDPDYAGKLAAVAASPTIAAALGLPSDTTVAQAPATGGAA